jgi:penicillin-binding protein 2
MRHRDHAWFVGFAPAEAPEVVVAALVEHGGHGGSAAAPVVQRVLAAHFGVQLPPPRPEAAPAPKPRPPEVPEPPADDPTRAPRAPGTEDAGD